MTFERIHEMIGGIPFISTRKARYLYELILREDVENVLELGIAQGADHHLRRDDGARRDAASRRQQCGRPVTLHECE